MSTENWVPLTKDQVEKRFIEMINEYLKLDLEYPLDPNLSIKDLKIANNPDLTKTLQDLDDEVLASTRRNYEVDSIDVLELVIQIEEEFGCTIDDADIAKLLRWEDLIGYITDSQDFTKIKKT